MLAVRKANRRRKAAIKQDPWIDMIVGIMMVVSGIYGRDIGGGYFAGIGVMMCVMALGIWCRPFFQKVR